MGVAEGVDLEGTDVGGEEEEVLCCRGEHVPGVKVEERHEEVEPHSSGCRDHKVGENVIS